MTTVEGKLEIFTEGEAAEVKRSEYPEPWTWSPVVNAMISNSSSIPLAWEDKLNAFENVVHSLYRCGFVIARRVEEGS